MKYYPLFLLVLLGCKDSKQVIYIEQPTELEVEVVQVRQNILPSEHAHVVAACPEDMHLAPGSGCSLGAFQGQVRMIRNSANYQMADGEAVSPQVLTEWICSAYNPSSVEENFVAVVTAFAVCQENE